MHLVFLPIIFSLFYIIKKVNSTTNTRKTNLTLINKIYENQQKEFIWIQNHNIYSRYYKKHKTLAESESLKLIVGCLIGKN